MKTQSVESQVAAALTPIQRSSIRASSGCDEATIKKYPNVGPTSKDRIEAAADALGIVLPGRPVRIKATRHVGAIPLAPDAIRVRAVNAQLEAKWTAQQPESTSGDAVRTESENPAPETVPDRVAQAIEKVLTPKQRVAFDREYARLAAKK